MIKNAGRAGFYVITRGTRLGVSVVLSLGFKSFTTCDGVNALYFVHEETDVLTAFDERLQKFVSSSSESLVVRTHTS